VLIASLESQYTWREHSVKKHEPVPCFHGLRTQTKKDLLSDEDTTIGTDLSNNLDKVGMLGNCISSFMAELRFPCQEVWSIDRRTSGRWSCDECGAVHVETTFVEEHDFLIEWLSAVTI
jgi:hypothetical protein